MRESSKVRSLSGANPSVVSPGRSVSSSRRAVRKCVAMLARVEEGLEESVGKPKTRISVVRAVKRVVASSAAFWVRVSVVRTLSSARSKRVCGSS